MIALLASHLAAAFYSACAVCAWRKPAMTVWLTPIALVLHFVALAFGLVHEGSLRIGVTEAASLFAWQSAVLLWLFTFREPVGVNGVAVYPLAALFAIWAALVPSPVSSVRIDDWQVSVHVLLSLLSAGLLTLAAVQAVALAIQDRLLHRRRIAPTGGRMPPLQTMEQVLFQLIAVGFGLLSLTLLSGLWFVHDWLAQHLAHKTVLSVSAWSIFGVLLWGRWRHGWRGRTAIRWALAGYATLILSYFGSKLILEQLFGKHWV
ncbi:MAG: cytochrome C assembly family protein [Panacagrimonas sp.]